VTPCPPLDKPALAAPTQATGTARISEANDHESLDNSVYANKVVEGDLVSFAKELGIDIGEERFLPSKIDGHPLHRRVHPPPHGGPCA
jgi:hypothetical protein